MQLAKEISRETQAALDHLTGHGWAIVGYNATGLAPTDVEQAVEILKREGYRIDAPGAVVQLPLVEQHTAVENVISRSDDISLASKLFFEQLRSLWITYLSVVSDKNAWDAEIEAVMKLPKSYGDGILPGTISKTKVGR